MARSSPERIADTSVTSAGTTLGAALDKPLSRLLKVRPVTMNGLRFLKRFRPKRRCAPSRERDATPTLAWPGRTIVPEHPNLTDTLDRSIDERSSQVRRRASIGIRGQLPVPAPPRRTCSAHQQIGTPLSGAPGLHLRRRSVWHHYRVHHVNHAVRLENGWNGHHRHATLFILQHKVLALHHGHKWAPP